MRREKGDTLPRTGTMQISRLLGGTLLCALLLSSTAAAELLDGESEEELSPRALRDFYPKGPNLTSEKQLVRVCVKEPFPATFLFYENTKHLFMSRACLYERKCLII